MLLLDGVSVGYRNMKEVILDVSIHHIYPVSRHLNTFVDAKNLYLCFFEFEEDKPKLANFRPKTM